MSVQVQTLTYLVCEQCNKKFGGPDAGEYPNWNPDQLLEMLIAEARELFWIEINCGPDNVMVCSKKCGKAWIAGPECYANAK